MVATRPDIHKRPCGYAEDFAFEYGRFGVRKSTGSYRRSTARTLPRANIYLPLRLLEVVAPWEEA